LTHPTAANNAITLTGYSSSNEWPANWNPNFGQLAWAIVEKTNLPPWLHAPTVSQIVSNFTHFDTSIGKSKFRYVNGLPDVKLKK
jgi:hypothetical protein